MGKSIIKEKRYAFAIKIVTLSQFLQAEKKEYVLSKQILRSGTSIGALIREAEFGQSKPDFIHKMSYYPLRRSCSSIPPAGFFFSSSFFSMTRRKFLKFQSSAKIISPNMAAEM